MTPGRNLTLGALLFVVAFAVSAVSLYAGSELVDRPEPATATDDELGGVPGGPVTVQILAKDQRFDRRTISASTGVPVTVVLDNQDPGTLHNVAFYTTSRATQIIFQGQLFPGPAVREETFTSPSTPGNYFFRCDAHPDTMIGTFRVQLLVRALTAARQPASLRLLSATSVRSCEHRCRISRSSATALPVADATKRCTVISPAKPAAISERRLLWDAAFVLLTSCLSPRLI